MNIISDNDIDEDMAKEFLSETYDDMNLLPRVHEALTENLAASILNVSEPTIRRMVADKQIDLTKASIAAYIKRNYLANRPLNLTPNSPISPQIDP